MVVRNKWFGLEIYSQLRIARVARKSPQYIETIERVALEKVRKRMKEFWIVYLAYKHGPKSEKVIRLGELAIIVARGKKLTRVSYPNAKADKGP